jgi:aspartate ammonia-lyase
MLPKFLYGAQTKIAKEIFRDLNSTVSLKLIESIVTIKKAAAIANYSSGRISKRISSAIEKACDEILRGKHHNQFVTSSLQGGAGTLINVNVNEVVATIATNIGGLTIHPNDHVNFGQSTNDVNPSALRITCIKLSDTLVKSIDKLISNLQQKSRQYKNVKKLARTHMQDAIPETFGDVFSSWSNIIETDKQRLKDAQKYLYFLNLGGTAIGNGINSNRNYHSQIYITLKNITKLRLKPANNLMSLTSSSADFCNLSSAINIMFNDLSKIAHDIRFLSSGPRGGIGELTLPEFANGSTIMPGKINPIIPESVNQVYYFISGKNHTIHLASENADQELSIMFPVISESLISILEVANKSVNIFSKKCISLLKVNVDKSKENLDRSFAYATLLMPTLGYDKVKKIVQNALENNSSLEEVVLKKNILTKKEFDKLTTTSKKIL